MRPPAGPPSPRMLAAGERWARGYQGEHPAARTQRDQADDFDRADAADEAEQIWNGGNST